MPFHVIENILRVLELLITTFEISVDGVLLSIVQACLLNCFEHKCTKITGHIKVLVDFLVILLADLRWTDG